MNAIEEARPYDPDAMKAEERERVLNEVCEWLSCNDPRTLYHHIKNNMRGKP